MDAIENVYDSLTHYFDVLGMTGSYNKKDTKSLLVYAFIVSVILNGSMQEYIEDEDVAVLNRLLDCFGRGSCLINIPVPHGRIGKARNPYGSYSFRESETLFERATEGDAMRTVD